MHKHLFPAICVAMLIVPQALALENLKYECKSGDSVRHIELVYEKPASQVPCSVLYTRDADEPDQTKTLWRAEYEPGFCEQHIEAFLEKLERLGWTCRQVKVEAEKNENPKEGPSGPSS